MPRSGSGVGPGGKRRRLLCNRMVTARTTAASKRRRHRKDGAASGEGEGEEDLLLLDVAARVVRDAGIDVLVDYCECRASGIDTAHERIWVG